MLATKRGSRFLLGGTQDLDDVTQHLVARRQRAAEPSKRRKHILLHLGKEGFGALAFPPVALQRLKRTLERPLHLPALLRLTPKARRDGGELIVAGLDNFDMHSCIRNKWGQLPTPPAAGGDRETL